MTQDQESTELIARVDCLCRHQVCDSGEVPEMPNWAKRCVDGVLLRGGSGRGVRCAVAGTGILASCLMLGTLAECRGHDRGAGR